MTPEGPIIKSRPCHLVGRQKICIDPLLFDTGFTDANPVFKRVISFDFFAQSKHANHIACDGIVSDAQLFDINPVWDRFNNSLNARFDSWCGFNVGDFYRLT